MFEHCKTMSEKKMFIETGKCNGEKLLTRPLWMSAVCMCTNEYALHAAIIYGCTNAAPSIHTIGQYEYDRL